MERYQQAALVGELMADAPTVIGLDGGPCGGKTTVVEAVAQAAAELDRPFELLPEQATIHISRLNETGESMPDLATSNRPRYLEVQRNILRDTVAGIRSARERHAGTNAIIVADRVEPGVYMEREEYAQIQRDLGMTKKSLYEVDQLVYLPSVARENPPLYERLMSSNAARYETTEQAAATCARTLDAVRFHPELHVAWGGKFEEKIRRLSAAILQPEIEGEIKFAVPETDGWRFVRPADGRGDLLNTIAIRQSYHRVGDQEFRLRKSTGEDAVRHYHFAAKLGEAPLRHELQRTISGNQYEFLRSAEQIGNTIFKFRHVVLDQPDENGVRRLWFADWYKRPDIQQFHLETDVDSQAEYDQLAEKYPEREVFIAGAKSLAML